MIETVPSAGARAAAVVYPLASTRPAVSVTCHTRAASKTLASPLIVNGLRTFVFASGSLTRIPPRAERSGVGTGVGVGAGVGGGLALAGAVGVAGGGGGGGGGGGAPGRGWRRGGGGGGPGRSRGARCPTHGAAGRR